MRYLSLFSGIEMASLAWRPLGWTAVAVAEVDPFACAVLAHYYPDVPNLGDVSKISEETIRGLGPVDVAIFGFPCQDLSNAGKRKGLKNDDGTATRSGLFFDAVRLARIAGVRWIVGENVPGLFSSNGGRDFGAVLTELTGCTYALPRDGWANAGAATGPRGAVCWRTLDAQFAGLAQRRDRVFFVVDLGARADSEPLFPLLESVPRHTPPGVAARKRPPVRAARGTGRKSIWEQIARAFSQGAGARPARVVGSLDSNRGGADALDAEAGKLIPETSHTLRADGFDASEDGTGRGTSLIPEITGTMPACGGTERKHGHGWGQQEFENGFIIPCEPFFSAIEFLPQSSRVYSEHETAPTLQSSGSRMGNRAPQVLAYGGNNTTWPIDVATACRAKGGSGHGDFESETFIAEPVPLHAFSCKDDGRDASYDVAPTMRAMNFDASHANAGGQLAIARECDWWPPDVSDPITASEGDTYAHEGKNNFRTHNVIPNPEGIAFDTTQITHPENRNNPQPGDPCHPLAAQGHPPAYATIYEVRRLTPLECERLMGVHDGYTAIPYRGRTAADGPRYKAIGNGFAVPEIRWIGERIAAAEMSRRVLVANGPS